MTDIEELEARMTKRIDAMSDEEFDAVFNPPPTHMTPEYRKATAEKLRLAADILEKDLPWQWRWEGSDEWKDGDGDVTYLLTDGEPYSSPHHAEYLIRLKP